MKKKYINILAFSILLSSSYLLHANSSGASPYFSIRSQGVNAVRDLIGWQELINQEDQEFWYGAMAVTAEYTQSFKPHNIAQSLFGNDLSCSSNCGGSLGISGSRASTREVNDWLADYFGLPTDYQSTLTLNPLIRNVIVDAAVYFGFDSWVEGLYARLDIPLAHTRWNLQFCENILNSGSNAYSPGYFSSSQTGNAASNLVQSAADFLTGCAAPTLTNQDGSTVTFEKLTAARWAGKGCDCGTLTKTRLADIAFIVGYNFISYEDYHFGLLVRATAPTGNKPCGLYTFEPIVGNGGAWELGAGLTTHIMLWNSPYNESTLQLYMDANVTHLFNVRQCRVFDLCGKPNSRYMLAQKLTAQTNGLEGNALAENSTTNVVTPSDYEFADHFAPVANLTRRNVDVSVAVQGDVAIKFAYNNGNGFSWDLGYNFWGRTCEKICLCPCSSNEPLDGKTWVLKGDAQVYGFTSPGTLTGEVALAPSESKADIHSGTNVFSAGSDTTTNNALAITNPNIDNAQLATVGGTTVFATPTNGLSTNQTHTSIQPIFLSTSSMNVSGTQGLSQKVFTHFDYAWYCHDKYIPFVGVGGSAEFGRVANCNSTCIAAADCCTSSSSNCNISSLSQWSIWIKGGFGFN